MVSKSTHLTKNSTNPFSDTTKGSPRIFWKDHQREFPILASIARDIMSIPATGAGVERLVNSARDICHYRRGSLNPETIRDIMLYMCTTRFDMKEEQRLILQEYLSEQDIAASIEELDIQTHSFDAISDNEEDLDSVEEYRDTASLSAVAAGKRPTVSSGDEDSDTDELAFVDANGNQSPPLHDTQPRVSGRIRKKSRRLDGYIV